MKKTKSTNIISIICVSIMTLFMLSIVSRFLTVHFLVNRFHMDNLFTKFILWDNPSIENEETVEVMNTEESIITMNWAEYFPFDEVDDNTSTSNNPELEDKDTIIDKYLNKIENVKAKISEYSEDLISGQRQMALLSEKYNKLLSWTWTSIEDYDESKVINMGNGYFTYADPPLSDDNKNEMVASIAEFSDYLKEMEIPMLFVNTGSKVSPVDKQMSYNDQLMEYTNENGDTILEGLKGRDVDVLDMRQLMIEDNLDWYSYFYKTDHHWTTEAALWAAGKLAKILNDEYDFGFDEDKYSKDQYEETIYEDIMFGAQGRAVTFANADLENYTKIIPRYETDISISIPTKEYNKTGDYEEVVFDNKNLENVLEYSKDDQLYKPTAYESTRIKNYAYINLINNLPSDNKDKNILILQDSFSWYTTGFLACDAGEINILYNRVYDGSVRKFVEDTHPDIVIIMLSEMSMKPINWDSHMSMMDFR